MTLSPLLYDVLLSGMPEELSDMEGSLAVICSVPGTSGCDAVGNGS